MLRLLSPLALLSQVMMAVGGCSALGSPVIGCYMNPDKRFAFVEFRSVEEASNAMAFDGVTCQVRFFCALLLLLIYSLSIVGLVPATYRLLVAPSFTRQLPVCIAVLHQLCSIYKLQHNQQRASHHLQRYPSLPHHTPHLASSCPAG